MSEELLDEAADPEVVIGEVLDGVDLPDDPDEAIAFVLGALAEARAEAASHLDDLKRLAAELENFRKRAARERDDLVTRATQRLVQELLPVLDAFDAGLAVSADSPGAERLLAGMQSTHQQLMAVLEREGVGVIAAAGAPFDPAVHEAVSGGGTGHLVVTAEMRRGYTLGDRVLRPALVAVAADEPDGDTEGP